MGILGTSASGVAIRPLTCNAVSGSYFQIFLFASFSFGSIFRQHSSWLKIRFNPSFLVFLRFINKQLSIQVLHKHFRKSCFFANAVSEGFRIRGNMLMYYLNASLFWCTFFSPIISATFFPSTCLDSTNFWSAWQGRYAWNKPTILQSAKKFYGAWDFSTKSTSSGGHR